MNKELDFVKGMFDKIAPRYDFLNHLLSLGQDRIWRAHMVRAANVKQNSTLLDVACGTCDVALAASRSLKGRARIIGLDFSPGMLKSGQQKLKRQANRTIFLVNGDALALPLKKDRFDAVFIAFGIRNIMDRHRALKAFKQVLKKEGRLVILELTTPEHKVFRQIYLAYFQKVLPFIGSFFSKDDSAYQYLPQSVLRFPAPNAFLKIMKESGFQKVRFKQMTFGIVTLFVGIR